MSPRLFLLFAITMVCSACLTWKPVSAALTETPNDTVALLRSRATLKCSTDFSFPIDWYFYPLTSPKERVPVYLNTALTYTLTDKYKVNSSVNGTYELIMESVDWSHVGIYVCYDKAGIGVNASVTLTVLNSNPKWSVVSAKSGGLSSPCSSLNFQFSYSGSQKPSLQWETGNKSKVLTAAEFIGSNSTDERPHHAKFINLTMDLCEQLNDTNYYLVCAWNTIQNLEDGAEEFVTHAISLQQHQQKKTIVALQCKRHLVPDVSQPFHSEQHSGTFTWRPILVTAGVLLMVIAFLVLYIIVNRRNHARKLTFDRTIASVNVNTTRTENLSDFSSEPSYANLSTATRSSTPLYPEGITSLVSSPRGNRNPVYAATHRNTRLGPAQVRASRSSPDGQDNQILSEDPLNRTNRVDRSHASDYIELIE